MSNKRMVQQYTKEAIQAQDQLSHEEYKRIKHMQKIELVYYLKSVWNAGYLKGQEAGIREAQAKFNAEGIKRATEEKTGGAESEG